MTIICDQCHARMQQSKNTRHKKVLHDCKRHTAHCIASTHSAVLPGGYPTPVLASGWHPNPVLNGYLTCPGQGSTPVLSWQEGAPVPDGGTPILGYPACNPWPGIEYHLARNRIPPGQDWGTLQPGMRYSPGKDLGKNLGLGYIPRYEWTDTCENCLTHSLDVGSNNVIQ